MYFESALKPSLVWHLQPCSVCTESGRVCVQTLGERCYFKQVKKEKKPNQVWPLIFYYRLGQQQIIAYNHRCVTSVALRIGPALSSTAKYALSHPTGQAHPRPACVCLRGEKTLPGAAGRRLLETSINDQGCRGSERGIARITEGR